MISLTAGSGGLVDQVERKQSRLHRFGRFVMRRITFVCDADGPSEPTNTPHRS